MTVTKDDLGIEEVTAGKAAQTQTVEVTEGAEVVAEILKSLRMPRPKKDNQEMVVVHVSLRNPLRNKLSINSNLQSIDMIHMSKNRHSLKIDLRQK